MKRHLATLLVTTLAALGLAGVSQVPAASACDLSNHCYQVGFGWGNYGSGHLDKGGDVVLCTNVLFNENPANDLVDNEFWVAMPDGSHWTEAGVLEGVLYNYTYTNSPRFFWADNNTKYGFNQHVASYGPAGGEHDDATIAFEQGTGNWWYVNVNGFTGSSWQNSNWGGELVTGSEYTSNTTVAESGSSSGLSYFDQTERAQSPWLYLTQRNDASGSGYWQSWSDWREEVNSSWSC